MWNRFALLCEHCCWKCRHFQALFGLSDIGRQQSDQTICFASGWLCNCSFSTVSHSKSAERKNIARNANAVQVTPWRLMSGFKFLFILSGIVRCVTESLNLSQCLCLLVPLLWSIVRKVTCANNSSIVFWRLWNQNVNECVLTQWYWVTKSPFKLFYIAKKGNFNLCWHRFIKKILAFMVN